MTKEWLEELMHEKLLLITTDKAQEAVNILFDEFKELELENKKVHKINKKLALHVIDVFLELPHNPTFVDNHQALDLIKEFITQKTMEK